MIDYSELNMDAPFPVSIFNSETILFTNMVAQSTVSGNNVAFVNPELVNSYLEEDLRAGFLVNNAANNSYFKGSYTSRQDVFTGVALDEILLILAESMVRQDRIDEGVNYLNQLLMQRFRDFIPYTANSKTDALGLILDARRKSLVFRGQRWADLKRLSVLGSEPETLTRQIENDVVNFTVSMENMILKIPQREIDLQ
ncbi:RagB/SusD family nutrient uptake outer membrane protein [Algoriphagus sp. NG3]|uniref:RagB/SusD family nutrient uptake outer membrane protein n=1 Tax=Algoriphagus sp. NG3 TaxID=3097546 RepID=UPI002A804128|nr:RagB/SusD family nutrient uptake outer membrane protein [Algoriphagus sp. NG3]WPR76032.1 RagB/SusD family nutrient uptake outer membrane protein [Algoriphagus sp. NG3]